jgi:hypothetical protein
VAQGTLHGGQAVPYQLSCAGRQASVLMLMSGAGMHSPLPSTQSQSLHDILCAPAPALHRPQTLDKHTNLATALLGAIKSRGLDAWHNTGEDILCGRSDLQSVIKLVSGSRGTAADRLRLATIWLLAYDGECVWRSAACPGTAWVRCGGVWGRWQGRHAKYAGKLWRCSCLE